MYMHGLIIGEAGGKNSLVIGIKAYFFMRLVKVILDITLNRSQGIERCLGQTNKYMETNSYIISVISHPQTKKRLYFT